MFALLENRYALYAFILIALCGYALYEKHHLIEEGRQQVQATDNAARNAQKAQDAAIHSQVVSQLRADNEALRSLASEPRPVTRVRVCTPTSVMLAGESSPGAQPPVAGSGGSGAGSVSQGSSELDLGPALQNLRWAAAAVSKYRDDTWDWAVKQSQDR